LVAITAQQILDENGWVVADIAIANLEYLIDNAINYINMEAGISMSNLTGASPNKTVTLTSAQEVVVKMLAALLVRAYLDKGPNVAVQSISVTSIISDPHYRIFMKLINKGIKRLRGTSFERV